MAQRVKTPMPERDDALSSIPSVHMVEIENQFRQVVL